MLAGTPCLGEYFPEEKRKKSLSHPLLKDFSWGGKCVQRNLLEGRARLGNFWPD